MPKPHHLPVNVFHVTHEMLKDWYIEPDPKVKGQRVLVIRQVKLDGEEATVKCIRIPQDQWAGLVDGLTALMEADALIEAEKVEEESDGQQ